MNSSYIQLCLTTLLLLLSPPAFAIYYGDKSCELILSREDYERGVDERKSHGLSPQEALYRDFLYNCFGFLSDHLRWPERSYAENLLEASKSKLIEDLEARRTKAENGSRIDEVREQIENSTVDEILRGRDVMNEVITWFPNRYLYTRRKIASAYIRAVRQSDLPKAYRTVSTNPSADLIFYAALKTKSNGNPKLLLDYLRGDFSVEHMRDLYEPGRKESARTGFFPQPLIFPNGEAELLTAARFDAPFAFANFHDTKNIITQDRAQRTVRAIENAKGFVAVSWTAGKPIPQDYLESLLALLEKNDWILLVGPTLQNFEELPEIFLNHPRIHLVTHTLENTSLKISNEPINPDLENPMARLKKAGRYKPGQTVIVFHPHQMLETVSTLTNDVAPVLLVSTGSINEPFAPFSALSQGGNKIANKTFHKMKAFIFEKADAQSEYDADGAQNIWHPRPLSYYDDREYDGTAGVIDMFTSYQFRYDENGGRSFEMLKTDPENMYLGDGHTAIVDQKVVQALVRDLPLTPTSEVTFISGDTLDNGNISRHSNGQLLELGLKAQNGSLSLLAEINGNTQFINAILQRFPKSRWAELIGNHDEWLNKLLEQTPDLHRVLNGDFIDELGFATKTLGMNVWDYVFKQRERILNSLLAMYPEKRSQIIQRLVPAYDPSRILILDRGSTLFAGPPHRKNVLSQHGDRTNFGQRSGTLKDQAKAMPEGGGVTGHTHRLGIYAENMDPGALAPIDQGYAKGFFNGSGQGFVAVYPNGTKQLIIYNPRVGTFRQRDPKKVLPPEKFFGDSRLQIIENDNQRVNKNQGLEYIRTELMRLKYLTVPIK